MNTRYAHSLAVIPFHHIVLEVVVWRGIMKGNALLGHAGKSAHIFQKNTTNARSVKSGLPGSVNLLIWITNDYQWLQ